MSQFCFFSNGRDISFSEFENLTFSDFLFVCSEFTACATSDTAALTTVECKCDASATTNECKQNSYCWTDNTCAANAKPTDCTLADSTAISGGNCRCDTTQTTAECADGSYCWLHNSVRTCVANAKPTACTVDDDAQIQTSPCQCATTSTTAECPVNSYCVTGNTCQASPSKKLFLIQKKHLVKYCRRIPIPSSF